MPIYNSQIGAFRGTELIQTNGVVGGGKHVFVPLQGQKNDLVYPLFGAAIANPFRGSAKLFAGDLAEYRTDANGVNPKYYVLKTFKVVGQSSTTINVMRGGYYHIPFVGDVLMVAPDTIGGTGTAATVTAVTPTTVEDRSSNTTYNVYALTMSATVSCSKNDILVEAEEAGSNKAMLVKAINSVVDCDYDMNDTPSTTFGTESDSDFTNARYFVSFAFGGTMFTNRMSPLPQCVLDLNRSAVNGWFSVDRVDMEAAATKGEVAEQFNGVTITPSSDAPTTATKGKVGDIIVGTTKIYVCTNVSGTTYTWKGTALS